MSANPPRWQQIGRALVPHLITAGVAIAVSLALRPLPPPVAAPPSAIATLEPRPSATPSAIPPPVLPTPAPTGGPTVPALPEELIVPAVLAAEVSDLRIEQERLWSSLYLLRAATQIADSEAALQTNDFAEVERQLLTARASLDLAYAAAADRDKGPIEVFRTEINRLLDDLRLRPEGTDRRLRELRRLVVGLVDQG